VKLAAESEAPNPRDLAGGHTLWPLTGSTTRYLPLSSDTTCDAAVIGAGVSGALAGFLLAEAGLDVVVVDRGDVAGGSTAANTALLLYECDLPLHRLAGRMGERDAVEVYRLCRDALARFAPLVSRLPDSCGFASRPSLYLASRPEDVPALQREHEMRRRHGFAVDFLERDAAELDPVCFTRGLLAHAARGGARVHEQTGITDLWSDGDRVELTTAGGRRIRARHAILATGYVSERFLGRRLARNNSTYALATEPLGEMRGWPDRALVWETARPYLPAHDARQSHSDRRPGRAGCERGAA
jgi:glycine/D-amino acid oxidase-like deaminating enzyme